MYMYMYMYMYRMSGLQVPECLEMLSLWPKVRFSRPVQPLGAQLSTSKESSSTRKAPYGSLSEEVPLAELTAGEPRRPVLPI